MSGARALGGPPSLLSGQTSRRTSPDGGRGQAGNPGRVDVAGNGAEDGRGSGSVRRSSNTGGGNRTHTGLPPEDFKSSASAIPPRRPGLDLPSIVAGNCYVSFILTEGVGFEPTVGFHLLRFSRPSQSTTLAPLPIEATIPSDIGPRWSLCRAFTVRLLRPGYRRRRRSAHRPSRPARSRRSAANQLRRALPRGGFAAWRNRCAHEAR